MQCMARRTRSKKRNKIQPAEMTITASLSAPAGFTTYYCDLSQMASLANRRFYRQGLNWAVGGIKVRLVQSGLGSVSISKLPTTWTFANSWTKGFRTWQEMNKKAEDDDNVAGRFLDFKIYADSAHHAVGYGANLLPISQTGAAANAGEWIPSEMRIPTGATTTTAFEIIGVGGNYPGAGASTKDAVSLIDGYAASRALPSITDPNTPDDLIDASGATPENWMTATSNEGLNQDSGVLDDIQAYDQPPYPYENDGTNTDTMYPGGPNQLPGLVYHDATDLSATTISGSSRMKGGNFPCGLVRIDVANSNADPSQALNLVVFFDMVPGDHRGYLAESMLEM